jgi:hypothetical protein
LAKQVGTIPDAVHKSDKLSLNLQISVWAGECRPSCSWFVNVKKWTALEKPFLRRLPCALAITEEWVCSTVLDVGLRYAEFCLQVVFCFRKGSSLYNVYPSIHSVLSADDVGRYPIITRGGIAVEMGDRLTCEYLDFVL